MEKATCYFLLNYAWRARTGWTVDWRGQLAIFFWIMPDSGSGGDNKSEKIKLAIFFWIMRNSDNLLRLHSRASLAIFFWIMLVPIVTSQHRHYIILHLLFSFELCVLEESLPDLGPECLKLAIFFWIMHDVVYKPILWRDRLVTCYFLLNYAVSEPLL